MKTGVLVAALFALQPWGATDALSQSYPARPVKLVVGFPPGSSADILGRIYAQKLSESLKQQFVVENRAGASGNIAAEFVARSEPDGYTLVVGSVANTISASILKSMKYSITDDLAPVAAFANAPNVIAVTPALGVSDVAGLIKVAKTKPGEILYGSPGTGSAPHLAGELFNMMADVRLTHVPYQGVPASITDLLGGRIGVVYGTAPTVAGHVTDGRIRLLAVTSAQRLDMLPDTPTLDESGLKGFDTSIWYGVFAPKNTPEGVRKVLADALVAANQTPEVKRALYVNGANALDLTLERFGAFVRTDVQKWKDVVTAAKIPQN